MRSPLRSATSAGSTTHFLLPVIYFDTLIVSNKIPAQAASNAGTRFLSCLAVINFICAEEPCKCEADNKKPAASILQNSDEPP